MTSTMPHRLPSRLICQPAIVSASFGKAAGRRTRSTPPLSIADVGYVLETGDIALEGRSAELAENPRVIVPYPGLGSKF